MSQRPGTSCESTCQEHSGLKTMIMVVLVGIGGTLAMQTYNNFYATTEIKTSIAELKSEINGIKTEMRAGDIALDKRITCLEDVVYRGKK